MLTQPYLRTMFIRALNSSAKVILQKCLYDSLYTKGAKRAGKRAVSLQGLPDNAIMADNL